MACRKENEWDYKASHIAHDIAVQIAETPGITYYGALEIAEHIKSIIERSMKMGHPSIEKEIRNKWGLIVEPPKAEAKGGGN